MRIYSNGVYRDATIEEVAEMERLAGAYHPPEKTPEERIAELEEELKAAKILLGLEV